MLNIGCHLSASKGFAHMANEALGINANTFQFFTRNPRGFACKEISPADAEEYKRIAAQNDFCKILAHAPYTLNPASADEGVRALAKRIMQDDMKRMELVPGNLYNFHPGSHVGQGEQKGTELIVDLLNEVLTEEQTTVVLLETMAGKGTEIGRSFEQLRTVLDGVRLSKKVGVCLDTCHVYDAGYDIVNNLDAVLDEFDAVIGLDRLCALHLNDSKNPMGSHKDRHEKIGQGYIGAATFEKIVCNPRLKGLPMFLETPNDIDGYAAEVALLRKMYAEHGA